MSFIAVLDTACSYYIRRDEEQDVASSRTPSEYLNIDDEAMRGREMGMQFEPNNSRRVTTPRRLKRKSDTI